MILYQIDARCSSFFQLGLRTVRRMHVYIIRSPSESYRASGRKSSSSWSLSSCVPPCLVLSFVRAYRYSVDSDTRVYRGRFNVKNTHIYTMHAKFPRYHSPRGKFPSWFSAQRGECKQWATPPLEIFCREISKGRHFRFARRFWFLEKIGSEMSSWGGRVINVVSCVLYSDGM